MSHEALLRALETLGRFYDEVERVIRVCKRAGVPVDDLIEEQIQARLEWQELRRQVEAL